MTIKSALKWLLIAISGFLIVSVFAVLLWLVVIEVHKSLVWPQIAKDFEGWSQLKGDVAFTRDYLGTNVDILRYDLEEAGFSCAKIEFNMNCEYLTDTWMDEIYWKLKLEFQDQGQITNIRGYIHSVQ